MTAGNLNHRKQNYVQGGTTVITTKYFQTNKLYALLKGFYVKFIVSLKLRMYYIHFTDEEAEVHKVQVTCSRSIRRKPHRKDLKPCLSALKAHDPSITP